jgi:predicted heme/steroid binding protein
VKILTWSEVAKHNNINDCWLVVDGYVYDVTEWVSHHPGGKVIATLAGEDASVMINSAHLVDIGNKLEHYKIGRIEKHHSNFRSLNDEFLNTLKKRAKSHFTENNIDYRRTSHSHNEIIFTIIFTIILLLTCWCCMYFLPPLGVAGSHSNGSCNLLFNRINRA